MFSVKNCIFVNEISIKINKHEQQIISKNQQCHWNNFHCAACLLSFHFYND